MAKKMGRGLVALSSAAVAAVYLTGYGLTHGPDVTLAAGISATPTALAVATSPASTSGYKDGTYTGTGTSRRGGVDVAVTISGGRIAGVQITRSFTEYPVSRIASLPAQVIARQSAQVDRVTGATYSTQAFQTAVQQALALAHSA